jgi:isopenicillin-N N-acyltransferase-like protein
VTVPFVAAAGDHLTIGRQHGAARASALRAFLDDGLARLAHIMPTPVSLDSLSPMLGEYRAAIAGAAPGLAEEIRGLAEGAGIGADEALLLQLRREIVGYHKVGAAAAAECTTYATADGDGSVLAQTVDLNGNLDDQICVLDVAPARGRVLVLSFGGLLGFVGLNAAGLAVGLNLVLGGEWGPGLPPYLAVRHLLDSAGCVDEAISQLAGLRLASSRCITLCDPGKAAWVEVLGDRIRVVQARQTVHTNHFLHPDFAAFDEINVFARNSSVQRLQACRDRLSGLPPAADPETHFAVLAQPPICVPDEGDIRRDRTVAAVVMLPARGELHLRPGDPSRQRTHVFALS